MAEGREARLQAARDLISRTPVWDLHGCMPLRPADATFLPQLQRYAAQHVDVACLNIGFGQIPLAEHLRVLAAMRRWLSARPRDYALPDSLADLDAACAEGRLSVLFDVEGMAILDEGDHGLVPLLAGLGVRWMLVAYNRANAAGGGCYDVEDGGLTVHGRAVIAEMKRAGMIVCGSHTGWRTARAAIEAADNPSIFSHSNAHAVFAHPRNIPDDLIDACAAGGGVVGINGIGDFLGPPGADLADAMARHVDHIAQRVGPRHVGLALDYVFDQAELTAYLQTMRDTFPDASATPRLAPPEVLPELVAALSARGYGDEDLAAILGGNWRRVAAAVWT